MRARHVLLAVVAVSGSFADPAVGQGCRFVGTTRDHRLVSTGEDGAARATFAKGEQGHWAAAWSPDGTQVLYSAYPSVQGDPVDVHLAKADGTDLGTLTVTASEPRNYNVEGIGEIHWLDETRFWYVARIGHQGTYVDVWQVGPQFGRSQLEARLGVAGGPCSLSDDLMSLACVAENRLTHELGIKVFDYRQARGGEPPPEVGAAEDAAFSVIAGTRKDDRDTRVEGGLHWVNSDQIAFALRRNESLELATLQRPIGTTKSWSLTRQAVTGVDGRVKTIRRPDAGFEIETETGVFKIGGAMGTSGAGNLVALKLRLREPLSPSGMTEFSVLDRWCPDDIDRIADRAVDH